MKKWIIAVVVLAVAVAAGAFYVLKILPGPKSVSSLESLVSEDALFYTYSYNPGKKIQEFQASDFFNKLSQTDVYRNVVQPQLDRFYQNAPFLSDFLENDVAMAFLSLGNPQPGSFQFQDIGDFLILVRLDPKKRAQLQRQIMDAYLSVSGKGKTSSKTYKGIKISRYTSLQPAFTINYAFIADVLALSNNANVIPKSIDLYLADGKASLLENADFQSIKSRIKADAWSWGYHNNEAYNRQLFAYYTSGALRSNSGRWAAYAIDPSQVASMMEFMNLIRVSAFSLEQDILKDGFLCKGYYVIGEPKSKAIREIAKFITDKKVLREEVLSIVPRDVLLYVGVCKDISSFWRFIKLSFSQMAEAASTFSPPGQSPAATKEAREEMDAGLAKLDSFLGVSMEKDILPALGDNFGLVVVDLENTEINMFGGPPQANPSSPPMGSLSIAIPLAYTYLEVKDVSKISTILEDVMQKLLDKANRQIAEKERRWKETLEQQAPALDQQQEGEVSTLQEEQPSMVLLKEAYQEAEIFYIDVPNFPVASLKPNYCFLDKYLIFSYSLPLTKKVINAYKSKRDSFVQNLNFSSVRNKIPAGYSDIAFFDIRRSVEQLKRAKFFDSTVYAMLASKDPQGTTKESLDQFLDILSDLFSVTSANRIVEDSILENNVYIKIKGL